MKTLLRNVALTAVALGCFTASTQAREVDYIYEVYACDVPTHVVTILSRGESVIESYHHSEGDAIARAKELNQLGHTVDVEEFSGHQTHLYIEENSVFLKDFDDIVAAEKYAAHMEAKTGWVVWGKTVEVYSSGP